MVSAMVTCVLSTTTANTSVPKAISQKHPLRNLAQLRVEILVEFGFGENNFRSYLRVWIASKGNYCRYEFVRVGLWILNWSSGDIEMQNNNEKWTDPEARAIVNGRHRREMHQVIHQMVHTSVHWTGYCYSWNNHTQGVPVHDHRWRLVLAEF